MVSEVGMVESKYFCPPPPPQLLKRLEIFAFDSKRNQAAKFCSLFQKGREGRREDLPVVIGNGVICYRDDPSHWHGQEGGWLAAQISK